MRFITGLVFIINLSIWLIGIILGFAAYGCIAGISIILGFISFLLAWRISDGMITSIADYFFNPEWSVFTKKLKWANSIGVLFTIIFLFTLYVMTSEA